MAQQVLIYDTTLRDGMQGEGMSLSVDEKVRVAHALDDLGVHFIEAGFPSSNPKEAALFDVLSRESFEHAQIAAFGMTRRKGAAAPYDQAMMALADCFAPVCTIVGKTWALHLEKVTRVDPEENLQMIGESIAFLKATGKRVIYDAEHFFDAYRDDVAYALACLRAAVDAGAENVTLCDTNGASLPSVVAEATAHVVAELGDDAGVGIHTHDDAGCGVANSLLAVEQGARLVQGTMNGYGERCGNANLTTILPDLQLKLGFDCVPAHLLERLTETAHLVDEICNVTPNANQPYVGANAFAHKGGMHVAGVNRDARTFEHVQPADVGADRRMLISELSGRGTVQARADLTGIELDEEAASRVVDRVKDLEHRGYHLEAADGSFDLLIQRETGGYEPLFRLESWRVIVEKRQDGKVETEATIKIWVEGERYVRTAEGNGPVNALDTALRNAIGETYPHLRDIELVNFKVRILDERKGTGAVTRVLLDASDGHDNWGSIGVSENIIEASWEALVDSLEAGMLPARTERVAPGARQRDPKPVSDDLIPLARPDVGAREEQEVLDALRSRRLSLGPRLPRFERALGEYLDAPRVSAVSSGTAALHLCIRAAGVRAGDEVVTTPFSFVASANCLLYENATPVFCDIDRRTLNIDPEAAAAAITARTSGLLPVHIFGYPADMPAFEELARSRGLWLVEDACEALGAVHADGRRVGARGNLATFGFYPNKQLTTGEGGAVVSPTPEIQERIESERNQGRSPDMGWLDHDRLGFNYRLSDVACALGLAQVERLDELLAARARVAGLLREALEGIEGLELPCADVEGDRRSWFVFVVQLPPEVDRDAAIRELRTRGVDSKPYLPAIHLMRFYRERFGHREGEFPVCEDVARRSLALPFFPELSERQVDRVGSALREVVDSLRTSAQPG